MNQLYEEQPLVLTMLSNMIKRRQIPHALLFYGDKSTSKLEVAKYFTKMIYANYYCSSVEGSPISKRIDDGSFSNLTIIEPIKREIVKDQILNVIDETSKTSLEEGPKVFIFDQADTMNMSSSNKFLKSLEEPGSDVYYILIVSNLSQVISTIKSRCILVPFRNLNQESVKEKLSGLGYDEEITEILVEYTQNIDEIENIISNEDLMSIVNLMDELFSEKIESTGSFPLVMREYMYLFKESAYNQDFCLSLLSLYLKDILNYKVYKKEDFIFQKSSSRIKELSMMINREDLIESIKETLSLKSKINDYINIELNLNSLLLNLELKFKK